MAMTNKSLLAQYQAAVEAIKTFDQRDKEDPEWTHWMQMVHKDSIANEYRLGCEIRKRGLEIPK